jgi:TonB family protein
MISSAEKSRSSETRTEGPCDVLSPNGTAIEAAAARLRSAPLDRSRVAYTGFAFFVHMAFLLIAFFVPPDPWGLAAEELLSADDVNVPYEIMAMEMIEQDVDVAETLEPDDAAQGGQGQRHEGEEGQMGREDAAKVDARFAIKGPADNSDPQMARERVKELVATSGILAALNSNVPTSPFGQETPIGADPEDAMGLLMGSVIGDSFGPGGLGVRGTGRGGGGDGTGTIGLGRLRTIGHGAGGDPDGNGYGPGNGRLRSRRSPSGPTTSIINTGTNVRGSLASDVIRRYIRRNLNSIRYCYEQELVRRPDLAGRVAVQFVISGQGSVSSSTVNSSTLGDPAAEQCVARAVQRIGFPETDDGGVVIVTYPFLFQPAE